MPPVWALLIWLFDFNYNLACALLLVIRVAARSTVLPPFSLLLFSSTGSDSSSSTGSSSSIKPKYPSLTPQYLSAQFGHFKTIILAVVGLPRLFTNIIKTFFKFTGSLGKVKVRTPTLSTKTLAPGASPSPLRSPNISHGGAEHKRSFLFTVLFYKPLCWTINGLFRFLTIFFVTGSQVKGKVKELHVYGLTE